MTGIEIDTPEDTDSAKENFTGQEALSDLYETVAQAQKRGMLAQVSMTRLYNYARGISGEEDVEIVKALTENLMLRRILKTMVTGAAMYHLPEAMAASTEDLPAREGDGCRIRMEESRAEPDQVYVIVELSNPEAETPSALVVCDEDMMCRQFVLPEARGGIAQLIAERGSHLVQMLANPKSEAYLK